MYVVVLNQNISMVRKTLFCGHDWRRGDKKFLVLFKREQKIFKAALGDGQMLLQHTFPISGAQRWQ